MNNPYFKINNTDLTINATYVLLENNNSDINLIRT